MVKTVSRWTTRRRVRALVAAERRDVDARYDTHPGGCRPSRRYGGLDRPDTPRAASAFHPGRGLLGRPRRETLMQVEQERKTDPGGADHGTYGAPLLSPPPRQSDRRLRRQSPPAGSRRGRRPRDALLYCAAPSSSPRDAAASTSVFMRRASAAATASPSSVIR